MQENNRLRKLDKNKVAGINSKVTNQLDKKNIQINQLKFHTSIATQTEHNNWRKN